MYAGFEGKGYEGIVHGFTVLCVSWFVIGEVLWRSLLGTALDVDTKTDDRIVFGKII